MNLRLLAPHWPVTPIDGASQEDGKYITASVSAGIDMTLHLAVRRTDQDRAQRIQPGSNKTRSRPSARWNWSKADVDAYWSGLGRGDADTRRAYFTPLPQDRPDVLEKMLA